MLSEASLRAFQARLRGPVLTPAHADYDDVRAVWNAMVDRRPAVIARCTGTADVIEAVTFARDHHLPVSVRGGGHNVAGTAVGDDALMIDLSLMRAVHVDPERRVARVQGGALLGDLDHETQALGLAAPGGVVSTTGVAGLTLGGGFGWLSRAHGLAADNLLAVEVVAADGRLIRASEHQEPDLFWGLRGGGGNFGVATWFEFRLHEVGPEILFGPTVHRLEDAADVLGHYVSFAREAPRACCVWADLLSAPPLPFLPERFHGTKVLSLMQCYVGDPRTGETVLAPLRDYGDPIGDAVAPTRYCAAQSLLDPMYDKGARNYWSTHTYADLPRAALPELVELAAGLPTASSDILISQVGGAINDRPADATAYPHRTAGFVVTPGVRWSDAGDDCACLAWIRHAAAVLAEHATGGSYVNFIAEAAGRERAAYGANYERLARLKKRYDPENRFRFNQNVRPAP